MYKVVDIIAAKIKRWWWLKGLLVGFFVFYGFGSYRTEDSGSRPWLCVAGYYLLAASVTWFCLARWVSYWRGRFSGHEGHKWEEVLRTGASASGWAVSVVFLWTLAGQLLPFFVLCRTERFIPWVLSFAFISSTLAAAGAYFSIGYPGMVNLERLEQRLRRLLGGANLATHLPRGLISSLEAELGMLRIIVGGIVSLYVLGVLTILLSLDRIPSLLGQTDKDQTFAELPVSEKVWFICGMALLLIACHVLVAGPVHGQHSRIILWLRHTTTEEQKGPQ